MVTCRNFRGTWVRAWLSRTDLLLLLVWSHRVLRTRTYLIYKSGISWTMQRGHIRVTNSYWGRLYFQILFFKDGCNNSFCPTGLSRILLFPIKKWNLILESGRVYGRNDPITSQSRSYKEMQFPLYWQTFAFAVLSCRLRNLTALWLPYCEGAQAATQRSHK